MKKVDRALITWAKAQLKNDQIKITALAGDASARCYYRVLQEGAPSLVLMDARQQRQECLPFLSIGDYLKKAGLITPEVYASDVDQGFMLLTDFGDELLIDRLQASGNQSGAFYRLAFGDIAKIQSINVANLAEIKAFDATFMMREMSLFQEWFLSAYRDVKLSAGQEQQLTQSLSNITSYIAALPQCLMHRDFHSRNIMCLTGDKLGIIDYQGAVIGPLVYDLVSLLKDCYISWPRQQVEAWVKHFYQHHLTRLQSDMISEDQFLYAFDIVGLQRHLKCAGLFARLALRDQKTLYLSELPRVLGYISQVGQLYSEFSFFSDLLNKLEHTDTTLAEESSL
ncbi:aminoglycoside phosphotransferase family protein [Piscirickettsia litoralis]|uniref:Phosphotransferase n=1 Tax=Piscirickettsia litoralis TaxID=1891921 RepID=A0ABX3A566_9GAMM|nr:phosphotransferase [Piscirickettsia litoralis]ODN44011.1 phosphotransferase [Piscirickettsia litoralis]